MHVAISWDNRMCRPSGWVTSEASQGQQGPYLHKPEQYCCMSAARSEDVGRRLVPADNVYCRSYS